MYTINIIYDTGDSFHQENGLEQCIKIEWKDKEKAKKALKDIETHYSYYMMLNKEWNAGKDEKEKALAKAKKSKWAVYDSKYSRGSKNREDCPSYWQLAVENDNGNRSKIYTFWIGYFEHLVGGDIIEIKDKEISFRT